MMTAAMPKIDSSAEIGVLEFFQQWSAFSIFFENFMGKVLTL